MKWGCDLQSEHERYLTEEAFGGCPVIVSDYPKVCNPLPFSASLLEESGRLCWDFLPCVELILVKFLNVKLSGDQGILYAAE